MKRKISMLLSMTMLFTLCFFFGGVEVKAGEEKADTQGATPKTKIYATGYDYYIDSAYDDVEYKGEESVETVGWKEYAVFSNAEYDSDIWVKYELIVNNSDDVPTYDLVVYPKAVDGWKPYLGVDKEYMYNLVHEVNNTDLNEKYFMLKCVVTTHEDREGKLGTPVGINKLYMAQEDIEKGLFVAFSEDRFTRDSISTFGPEGRYVYNYLNSDMTWKNGYEKYEGINSTEDEDWEKGQDVVVGLITVPEDKASEGYEMILGMNNSTKESFVTEYSDNVWLKRGHLHTLTIGPTYRMAAGNLNTDFSISMVEGRSYTVITDEKKFVKPLGYDETDTPVVLVGGGSWDGTTYTFGDDDGFLKPCWPPSKYKVTYKPNAPEGKNVTGTAVTDQMFYDNRTSEYDYQPHGVVIKKNTWTVEGYKFVGWYTWPDDEEETPRRYEEGEVFAMNRNLTLYAWWEKKTAADNEKPQNPSGNTKPSTGNPEQKPGNEADIQESITAPGAVTISSVKNNKKGTVTIKLKTKKTDSKVDGYEVISATSKKKLAKVKKAKTFTKAPIKLTKLKKRKTYYIKVRAYKLDGEEKVYGDWSSVKKIKIKK